MIVLAASELITLELYNSNLAGSRLVCTMNLRRSLGNQLALWESLLHEGMSTV